MLAKRGGCLILAGLNAQPGSLVSRSGFADDVGADNLVGSLAEAWQRAAILLPRAGAEAPLHA